MYNVVSVNQLRTYKMFKNLDVNDICGALLALCLAALIIGYTLNLN
jgi:hypothetical protein